jgi:polyphosphate glucokinase
MTKHTSSVAIGIDIGGTGIKGATVDLEKGVFVSDRIKIATPDGGRPDDIVSVVADIVSQLPSSDDDSIAIGVAFPAIVKRGRTLSAANVSDEWIGLKAEKKFEKAIGRDITFVNDADAAGFAEARFGAAKDVEGVTLVTTLGTGIGTALLFDGVLVPNAELGHLEIDGRDIETVASYGAKERDDLSWEEWAALLTTFYTRLERLMAPDLFIVGGGVSKHHEQFLPLIDIDTPIIPATHRNKAGILGAAAMADRGHPAVPEKSTTGA